MKYRILAVLITVLLMLQCFPCSAASVATADSADSTVVEFLRVLGIMDIDSKTGYFWDETPVRRAEMAEILCKLFQFEISDVTASRFEDVRGSNSAYVEAVVNNGYMSGYNDTEFGPNDYITNEQLIKIFVCVIGAGRVAEMNGGYPNGYIYMARRLDLIGSISAGMNDNARRIDVANMIYSALNADMMDIQSIEMNADGKIADVIYGTQEGVTFLTERLNIYHLRGVVKKVDTTSLNRADDGAGLGYVQIGKTMYKDPEGLADDFLGCEVNYFVKKSDSMSLGELLYIEESSGSKTITVKNAETEISGVNGTTVNYYEGERLRKLELYPVADMIYNGKAITRDFNKISNIQDGTVKFIDGDGDGRYEVIIITEYTIGVVDSVNLDTERIYLKFDGAPVVLEDNICKVFLDGEKATLEDISKGNVIMIAASSNTTGEKAIRIEASTSTKRGTIEAKQDIAGVQYLKIGGVEYAVSDFCETLEAQNKIPALELGLSGQSFYLDAKGRIAYVAGGSTGETVGFLVAISAQRKVFDGYFAVKIYTADGEFKIFEADEKLKINGTTRKVDDIVDDASLIYELENEVARKHLVLYKETDGILKEINYSASNSAYDAQKFSCDEYQQFTCHRNSVLNDKFYADNNTIVFMTPSLGTVNDEPGNYLIQKGNVFTATNNFTLKLYDIQSDGYIRYALRPVNSQFLTVDTSPLIMVTEIADGIDEEGERIKIIEGLNDSGKSVSVKSSPEYADFSQLKKGDVIQYRTDGQGNIRTILRLHNSASTTYYNIMAEDELRNDSRMGTGFGNVMNITASGLQIKCGELTEGMTPFDADKFVSSDCSAVYAFYKDREIVQQISFADIVRGDKIFACVNYNNKTRMIVIYR